MTHQPEQMDPLEELAAQLRAAYPQAPTVAPLTVLGEGFGSLVVETASGVVFRIAKNAFAQRGHRRERALLPLIAGHLPSFDVPDPVYHLPRSEAFPYGVIGYGKLPGRPLRPRDITGGSRSSIAAQLARFIRTLHRIPLHRLPDCDLPQFPPRAARLGEVWGRVAPYLRAHLDGDEYARVSGWWREIGCYGERHPYTPTLVHGDLWYDNILFDPDTRRIAGVIDFENLAVGDPAIDLVTQRYLGDSFAREIIRRYYGGQPPTELDERMAMLSGLREVMGLEDGILAGAIDSDTLDKIRRTIIDP